MNNAFVIITIKKITEENQYSIMRQRARWLNMSDMRVPSSEDTRGGLFLLQQSCYNTRLWHLLLAAVFLRK